MAKELSKSGISTGQDILAGHVTQSIDAFTGIEAYDVTVSGSLTITGSTIIQPTNVDTGTNVLTVDSSGKIYKTGSYSAGGGGATPTWQQVTDQGASTTNDLTITGNITASDLIITSSNFAVIARGAGNDIIQLASGVDSDIYIKGDDYISLNNDQVRITGSLYQTEGVAYFQPDEFTVDALGDSVLSIGQGATQNVKIGVSTTSTEVRGPLTASIISASNIVYGKTGSFSHLQGNSPITVGDSITFQQSITSSGDISSSGFLFITASKLDPASQVLTYNTESGEVHYANFHISTSTTTNTIGDDAIDLDFIGKEVSVIAQDDHKVTAKKSIFKNPTLQTVHSADYENQIFKWGLNSVTISASAGHISASGNITASELFLSDGKNGIKIDTHESAFNPPNSYGGNVSIGSFAGNSLSDDDLGNVIIGNRAGYTTTNNYNVFIGYKTGYEQPGGNNVFIGTQAGYYGDTLNQHNVAIGYEALRGISSSNHDSQNNVVIGYRAGKYVQNGNKNIILGSRSGFDITDGNHNIIIGPFAASGSGNINNQLIIGSASISPISASLTTGDIIFPSTASAAYFVGDGSQLTNLPGGGSSQWYDGGTYITSSKNVIITGSLKADIKTGEFIISNSDEGVDYINIDGDQQRIRIDKDNIGVITQFNTDTSVDGSLTSFGAEVGMNSWLKVGVGQTANDFGLSVTGSLDVTGSINSSGNITALDLNLLGGDIDLKNEGVQSNIKFYCEDNNAHYTKVQAASHSAYSGNKTLTLPAYDFDFQSPNFQSSITASGNISASGILYGTNLTLSGFAELGESGLRLRESPGLSATGILQSDAPFRSSQYLTSTNITASANISASGTITANVFVGDGSQLSNIQRPISNSVSTNVTASNSNAGYYFRAGGNITCSIQANATVPCDIGSEFDFFQTSSAGNVLFLSGSGVTLNTKNGFTKLDGQFAGATLKKVDTDEWDLVGDLNS